MVSFLICLALLIGGYFVYGKVVENTYLPAKGRNRTAYRGKQDQSGRA